MIPEHDPVHGHERPDPREDPETVIGEELSEHREAIEALADMELGVFSMDACQILDILDQEESA